MSREHVVARLGELQDGQMKTVEVDGRKVLLVRIGDQFFAYAAECPHHGADLAEGLLHEGHVRCPWHQAVYEARTGKLLEPPSLDSLPAYDVRVRDSEVVVTLPDGSPKPAPPPMAEPSPAGDGRTFVIVGTGAAGLNAAETLRQEGFVGRIVMLTGERRLPYDRTDLSKPYLRKADAKPPFLRSGEFFDRHGIEVRTGCRAEAVDLRAKTLALSGGPSLRYDRLLVAVGAQPRRLGVPGEDLPGVHVLRSLDDCEAIRAALAKGGRGVVVGASFIGMEVAAAMAERGLETTVVAPEAVPFEKVFGERIGRMYQRVQEDKGAEFRLGRKVERFEGDSCVRAVVLDDGSRLDADLVVVGVGVRPATQFLRGLDLADDGGVVVDAHLRAGEDVWAAGDIARFPDWRTGRPLRIEHWRLAEQLGRIAARNMVGKPVEYRQTPFFWTNQHMVITAYSGYCTDWDEIVFDGKPEEHDFLACYVKDGKVLAVAGAERDRQVCQAAELIGAVGTPTVDQVRAALRA